MGLVSNGLQRVRDDWAGAARSGARHQVDELAPPHRRVMTVFGRLVQNGQQTIVEAQG
jgi:hypothetical protein